MYIVPAILAPTIEELQEQLAKVADLNDLVSFDVASEGFVDGLTTPSPKDFPQLPEGKQVFWHLMVKNPINLIDECLQFSTKIIAVHAEAEGVSEALKLIKHKEVLAGLVFNPDTDISKFTDLIKLADVVQIMTVIPGAQGRDFDGSNLGQIDYIRTLNPNTKIAIDGGINSEAINQVLSYNPDYVVVGSFLTKAQNPKENFEKLIAKENDE